MELNSSKESEKNRAISQGKNDIFFPFADRSWLLERAHRAHTGQLLMAKNLGYICKIFLVKFFKDVKNVA